MKRTAPPQSPPAYPVAGVGNVLNLLHFLEERQRVKLSEVSAELGIGASTAHRLLSMFQYFGFVEKDERSHAYGIGPAFVSLAISIAAKRLMLDRIRPVLASLVDDLNETVHVAMLKGSDVVYMDGIESKKSERATSRTGFMIPAYATASGKAILAELTDEHIERLYPSESLARLTSHTLETRDALFHDLKQTRERGFAVNENESQLGFFACACPIRPLGAALRMSIVVAAPSRRFRKHRDRLAESLRDSAQAASVEISRIDARLDNEPLFS